MMELKLGIESLESYKRLSYKVWYALAEFIDNSTQSYLNNKDILDSLYKKKKEALQVAINYSNAKKNGYIQITDNSIGMNETDLQNALTIGKKPENTKGRSKYGMGLKTAAFWFGDHWEIITKKYKSEYEYTVTVNLNDIIRNYYKAQSKNNEPHSKLELKKTKKGIDEHYTIIRITKLNRTISSNTARRTKNYLRSIYRFDLQKGKFLLTLQNTPLKWDDSETLNRLLKDDNDIPYKKTFSFEVNKKKVTGWAGILESGSRKDAGFSLIQAERVIQGWPFGYRPESIFGDQEGGVNDLVNQRLFGELYLDKFDVSHTKDEILFKDDEEDILDEKLFEELADYRKVAAEYRKAKKDDIKEIDFIPILSDFFTEMKQQKFVDSVRTTDILPVSVIKKSNEELYNRIIKSKIKDKYTAEIAGIRITVIINSEGSTYDPYLIIRISAKDDNLGIIINKNHPYWETMSKDETILHFIEHCILDGIAEWKAIKLVKNIQPETIKMIKDNFLRQDLSIT